MKKQAICLQCHANPEMVNFLISVFPLAYFDKIDRKAKVVDMTKNLIEECIF